MDQKMKAKTSENNKGQHVERKKKKKIMQKRGRGKLDGRKKYNAGS